MTVQYINPEEYANQWTAKVVKRLQEAGVHPDEIEENRLILSSFIKTGAELLKKEPVLHLPDTSQLTGLDHPLAKDIAQMFAQEAPVELDIPKCDQLIDLFVRSVNQMSKTLRQTRLVWDVRKVIMEQAAWETFNLCKLLVSVYNMPNSKLKYMDDNKVLQKEMLRQGTQAIVDRHLAERKRGAR